MNPFLTPHVILGKAVYRLVEAQDPSVKKEPKAEAPQQQQQPVNEEILYANFDALEKKVVDSTEKAGVKVDDPAIVMTKEGFRYVVPVQPIGSLEGSASILTFDFGTTLVEDILAGDFGSIFSRLTELQGTGITQIVWEYGGKQMVAPDPNLMKALLKSIAVLQRADARVISDVFGGIEEGEMDEAKLQDWILNVAQQMAEHGVGAENYSQVDKVRSALKQMWKSQTITTQEHNYLLKGVTASQTGKDDDPISMDRFMQYIEIAVQEQMLKDKKAKEIIDVLRKIEREPANYFERDRFYRMMQQGAQEEIFSDEELNNAQKALDTFDTDATWQEALRNKIEKKTPTTVSKEDVIEAVDYWSSGANYNIEAGVQMTLTDENTIAAAIAAPFPFFYTFDTVTKAGKLTLLEAVMVFLDREIFVPPTDNAPTQLLKADVTIAQCLEQAVNMEMGKGTSPRTTQNFSDQLAKILRSKQSDETAVLPSKE